MDAKRDGLFGFTIERKRPASPSIEYLIAEAHQILDRAFDEHLAGSIVPLYSGGNDSACACHVTSKHHQFGGTVYTINTRTGAFKTKLHQRRVCRLFNWNQEVRRALKADNIETFAREKGLPGPGMHSIIYARIKQRVVRMWEREHKRNGRPVAFITGARETESTRRMGTTSEIQRGSGLTKEGRVRDPYQLWVAPIVHWTSEDKRRYMAHFGIPANPFTYTALSMSGECFCGAFADRQARDTECDEREIIRRLAPDVSRKIDILERIARDAGQHAEWGIRPPGCSATDGLEMLCQGCAARQQELFSE